MKMTMHYAYRSSNGVFSGQGTYTSDAIINVPAAIEEIRQKLHLDSPYSGIEITPVTFSVKDEPEVSWQAFWLILFSIAFGGGIVAGVVNTLIQSALR